MQAARLTLVARRPPLRPLPDGNEPHPACKLSPHAAVLRRARGGGLSLRLEWVWWGRRAPLRKASESVRGAWAAVLVIAGFLPLSNCLVEAQCTAPPELRAKIGQSPTAENYAKLGAWFATEKKFSCAATNYAAASSREPQSASYAYLWGLSLQLAGKNKDALAALTKAAELDGKDIRPHLGLGAVYDKLNQPAKSEAEYRAALAIDPHSSVALDSLSQEFLGRKDYTSVVALLEKQGSGNRTAAQSLNLGIAYAAGARLDDASRVLREGLKDAPESPAIADELAAVLMLMGSEKEAFELLESVLGKHPEDETTQVLYLRYLVSSRGEKAAEMADKLIAIYPRNWEVQYLKGVLEMRKGNFAPARSFFERSVALNPSYDRSRADFGNDLAQLGDLPGAKAQLLKAIELGDNEFEVHYNLGRVLMRMGETAQARDELKMSQEAAGAENGTLQAAEKAKEAAEAMSQNDVAKAASLYREAIDSDPKAAILYYKLSRALDKMSDQAGERAALNKAIELDPNLPEAQNQLGYLALHAGDTAGAEAYFRAAVQASPSYMRGWINLAATLAAEEKWAEARQAVHRALEVDPGNAQARGLAQTLSEGHPGP